MKPFRPYSFISLPIVVVQFLHFSSAAPAISSIQSRQDAQNPWDQSWVRKWTAIGDSYSAGIGAGKRLDADCARYDQSYPMFIQTDPDMGNIANREFTYLSCSGAVSKDMLEKQIPNMPDGQDLITISAGGNDVGLADILNHCVFQWASTFPIYKCTEQLSTTDGLLDNDLPGSLDSLYAAAKAKLAPGGTIYVTGYARFWGENEQCNGVTWSIWSANPNPAFLGINNRQIMNNLVVKTNQRIREAVERAGPEFVFVEYDEEYELMYGRFCENGVTETSANRENLLFYQWDTVDEDPAEPGRKRDDSEAPGTFEGQIEEWIEQNLDEHPDWETRNLKDTVPILIALPPPSTEISNPTTAMNTQAAVETAVQTPAFVARGEADIVDPKAKANLLGINFDGIKRVFHPRPFGHSVIAQKVLWHMANRRAKILNLPSETQEVHNVDTCTANQPPDVPQCTACSDGGGYELAGVCWGGDHDGSLCCGVNPFVCTQTGCNGLNGKCQGQYQGCPCTDPAPPPPPPPPSPPLCNGVSTDGWKCAVKCNGGPLECPDWCNANCNCMPNC